MTDNIIKDTLLKYFPAIDEETIGKYIKMADLYREWNAKINVISRTDIDNVFEHHILHSLSLAAFLGPNSKKAPAFSTSAQAVDFRAYRWLFFIRTASSTSSTV